MTDNATGLDKHFHKATLIAASAAVIISLFAISGIVIFPPEMEQESECIENICKDSVRIRTQAFTLAPGSLLERNISCEAGEVVIGGGLQIIDDNKLFVWKNAPAADKTAWGFGISNYGTSSRQVTGYAVCVKTE